MGDEDRIPHLRIRIVLDSNRAIHEEILYLNENSNRGAGSKVSLPVCADGHTVELFAEPIGDDVESADISEARATLLGPKNPTFVSRRDVSVSPRSDYWMWTTTATLASIIFSADPTRCYEFEWEISASYTRDLTANRDKHCDCGGRHTNTRHHYGWCSSRRRS